MSRGGANSNPRRNGRIATPPLLAGLLLAAALAPSQLRAQTNTVKAVPSAQRWLLMVETSRSMQRRADAVLEAVRDLLTSGMAGQLQRGDTLGVWTFNDDLYAGRFPLQTWSPEAQQDIASRTLTSLKGQKYEKQANFDKVLPALDRVIKGSALITVILISSGDEKMRGTPFDDRINEFYQKWHDQQQKARLPFVTVLRAKAGQLADYTLNTPPWPTQMPRLPRETQSAETLQSKLLEALHNAPPSTGPPLIISGEKTQAEKAPAPKPKPPGVTVGAPAPVPAATGTNQSVNAKPPVPAVLPVEMAKTDAAPVRPDKPSTELPPKPSPAPMPVTEPTVQIVKGPQTRPVAPAPPAAREVSPGASSTAKVTQPAPTSPSAIRVPPVQTATAVPAETLARHRSMWIAVLVLAGVAVSFAFLLFRRSRTAPGGSLITRSFERGKKQ
ncbi:MAG: hypothetical protein ABSD29_20735 [Verrucomicrobiota bacterium]